MSTNLRHVGLDVHAETIAVAVAEPGGEVRPLGIIPNRPEAVAKLSGSSAPAGSSGCVTKPVPVVTSSTGS